MRSVYHEYIANEGNITTNTEVQSLSRNNLPKKTRQRALSLTM